MSSYDDEVRERQRREANALEAAAKRADQRARGVWVDAPGPSYADVPESWIGSKPTNPKDIIGSDKLPLHLWPTTATALGSLAMLEGALKYGRSNFRAVGVKASIYYDACMRHLTLWFEGEDDAPDSGLPHLAHALACLAILIDAKAAGLLKDDRMYPGGYADELATLTPHVARLKAKYADRTPTHYVLNEETPNEHNRSQLD